MLGQRRRRWPTIEPTLAIRIVHGWNQSSAASNLQKVISRRCTSCLRRGWSWKMVIKFRKSVTPWGWRRGGSGGGGGPGATRNRSRVHASSIFTLRLVDLRKSAGTYKWALYFPERRFLKVSLVCNLIENYTTFIQDYRWTLAYVDSSTLWQYPNILY